MRSDQERLAGDEDAFRKRNEMLRLGQGPVGQMLLLCECGHADCTQPIRMTLEEYEQLRDHGGRFAIVKAHSIPEVERVVQRHDAYDVVEKVGEAGEEAARLDLR